MRLLRRSPERPPRNDVNLISNLFSPGMNFDLSRMRTLMAALGEPQDQFPSIHIAGTNGKGSVAAMISTVLRDKKLKVGLYTSPHLERVQERFQINHHPISLQDFARISRSVHKITR